MERYDGPERRQYRRYDCRYQTSFKPKNPDYPFDHSQIRNISKGGALFTAGEPFTEASLLEMILYIPFNPSAVKLEGEIIWRRKVPNAMVYEIGVQFIEQNPTISTFIEERLHNAV